MAEKLIDDELLALLGRVDTPTVCNAIEVAQKKRGFSQFTRGTMISSAPRSRPMVGYARTAKIAAVNPPEEPMGVVRKRRMDYYRYMSDRSYPVVAVIEDTDFPDSIGAYWGEINTTIHKGFGISGALTNGVMRDLGDLADDFPVVAGSIGPSHGFVHVCQIDEDVNIFDLTIAPGDLVHADRHGAVVIPDNVIPKMHEAIQTLFAAEKTILEPARLQAFDFEQFEKAWENFEKART
jgi:regulator of RNase E activity RraA